MAISLWHRSLNVNGPAFVAGFIDGLKNVFTPDRYVAARAQLEYEFGWAFSRWCRRKGVSISKDTSPTFMGNMLETFRVEY